MKNTWLGKLPGRDEYTKDKEKYCRAWTRMARKLERNIPVLKLHAFDPSFQFTCKGGVVDMPVALVMDLIKRFETGKPVPKVKPPPRPVSMFDPIWWTDENGKHPTQEEFYPIPVDELHCKWRPTKYAMSKIPALKLWNKLHKKG